MEEQRPKFGRWSCGQVGWAHYTAGLSTYTIDGEYLLGAWPGVGGLSVATGCNGSMLSAAGGVGRLVAAQVLEELGLPEVDGDAEWGGRGGLLEALGAERCEILMAEIQSLAYLAHV